MTNEWAAVALIAVPVALASLVLCVVALRRFEQTLRQERRGLRTQMEALNEAVRFMEARLGEIPASPVGQGVAPSAADAESGEPGESMQGESIDAEIAPEIQAAIAAAAFAAAGPGARVRSARLVKPSVDASAWSQQGRALVQSSHNVHGRR